MKTGIVKISHLVEIPELKAYYTPQSIDEIATSIETDGGMRSPIIVTENYEIIDGYRRVDAMKILNKEYINVLIDDVPPTVFERIIRNMYRTKTTDDLVKELKTVFVKFPKKMGKKITPAFAGAIFSFAYALTILSSSTALISAMVSC